MGEIKELQNHNVNEVNEQVDVSWVIDQTDHLDHLENTEVILCFSHLSMYLHSVYKDFEGERYCICYAGIVQKSIGFSS